MNYSTHGVFSDDVDLLELEPALFASSNVRGLRLLKGTATLADAGGMTGVTLTAQLEGSGDFTTAKVFDGHALKVAGGVVVGVFPIRTVLAATVVLIAPLHSGSAEALGVPGYNPGIVGSEVGVTVEVFTLSALARRVAMDWSRRLGVDPFSVTDAARLKNPDALRLPSALYVLGLYYMGRADQLAEVAAGSQQQDPTYARWRSSAAEYLRRGEALAWSTLVTVADAAGVDRQLRMRDREPVRV